MFRQVDLQIFRFINGEWTSPAMDRFMALVSDFGFWMIPLACVGLGLLIFGKWRARIFLLLVALSILIGDTGVVQGIRAVVNRSRPWQTLENVRYVDMRGVEIRTPAPPKEGRSFPSGHVCNNTAVALLASIFYYPWGMLMWLWVVLMSYSRIYTGAHYPSDVLASIPIAIVYTCLIYLVTKSLLQKFAPKILEKAVNKQSSPKHITAHK
ncbi:MAG: phosphatase PAP2 family protein [Verrucomicrobiota bacterium]